MTQDRIRREFDDARDGTEGDVEGCPIPVLDSIPSNELGEDVTTVFFGGGFFPLTHWGWYKGYVDWHMVYVSPFYISLRPVTAGGWREIMGRYERWAGRESGDGEEAWVSWGDAVRYCNKLSRREGLRPCYTFRKGKVVCDFNAGGYRLPTEAEFNYATPFYHNRIGHGLDIIPQTVPEAMRINPAGPRVNRGLKLCYETTWMWDTFDPEYHKRGWLDPAGADSGELRVTRIYPRLHFAFNQAFKPYRFGTKTEKKAQLFPTRSWMFETDVRKNNQMNLIPQWDRQVRPY